MNHPVDTLLPFLLAVVIICLSTLCVRLWQARNAASARARHLVEELQSCTVRLNAALTANARIERAVNDKLGVDWQRTIYPNVAEAITRGLRRYGPPPLNTFDGTALADAINTAGGSPTP